MQHQYRRTVSGSRAEQPDQKKSRIELPPGCVDVKHIPLKFAVVDARKMPYENETVTLILDKGTLDAMLSDKKDGENNCIQTLSECARVLAEGGAIMIVSHLNAHTPSGISWLEDVVFTSLRSGSGKDTAWTIEVHGNGDTPEEEEEEVSAVLEQSVGPAFTSSTRKSSAPTRILKTRLPRGRFVRTKWSKRLLCYGVGIMGTMQVSSSVKASGFLFLSKNDFPSS
jgi:hypothetical protein